MAHTLLLEWVLLAIGVQGMRVRKLSASLQSESDGKESGPKVHALVPLLLAFNPSASNAFAVGPGVSGVSTVGISPMISRSSTPEMFARGSIVRVLQPELPWFQEVGTIATIIREADGLSAVVRFDKPSGGVTRVFTLDDLVEIEAPPAKTKKASSFQYVPKAATAARGRLGPTMMAPEVKVQPGGTVHDVNPLNYRDDRHPWPAHAIGGDNSLWQAAATGDDVKIVMDTLSAANLVTPTGEEPGTQPVAKKGVVGTSTVLAGLDAWFQKNPEGLVALPLGPDGSTADQGISSSWKGLDARVASSMGAVSSDVFPSQVSDDSPDGLRPRAAMNLILLGGAAVPEGWLGGGHVYFFKAKWLAPAGLVAKDALGKAVSFDEWLSNHQEGGRNLVQGLEGNASYLIVTANQKIEDYALNAVCMTLDCVESSDRAAGKFMCPCRSPKHDTAGKVIRGPAPLSLALAHVDSVDKKVTLTPWTETEHRTGTAPGC